MRSMKPFVCIILGLSLASCNSKPRTAAFDPETYTYASIGDSDTLDPAWAYDTSSHLINTNIYESLFFYEGSSTEKLVPVIATKVPSKANGLISADGRVYTIPLRRGVKFHDGTTMTPEDVRYSLMRFMLQDRDAGPSSLLMEPVLGYPSTRDDNGKINPNAYKDAARAVRIEGNNLILTLAAPYAPILTILANWAPVVSRDWAAKNGDWDGTEATWIDHNNPKKEATAFFQKANGTGPFKLERWDRKTKETFLLRHDQYWNKPARLKRVVIKGITEFGTRKLMLQAGDADAIYADRSVYSQVKDLPNVVIIDDLPTMEANPVAYFTFQINPAGNPNIGSGRLDGKGIPPDFFSDLDVRKGFAYAFDYDGYLKDVFKKGKRATGAIPSSLPGSNPNQKVYNLDLEKAKRHFQKAWGGKVWENGFQFTLTFNSGNVTRQNLCQIMKRTVESVNPKFKIDVRPVEWPTFLDAYKASKLPIFVMGWNADYPDAHNFAWPMLHSKGSYPSTQKFKNTKFDQLIDQAIRETDLAKRKRLYAELLAAAHEFAPQLYFVDTVRYRTQRDWVKGWYHNPIIPDSPYGSYFYTIYKEKPGEASSKK